MLWRALGSVTSNTGGHAAAGPGARRPESIIDSAQAPQLRLTAEELSVLDAS
jgi:hypothetical protein